MSECRAHPGEIGNFSVNSSDVAVDQHFHVGGMTALVFIKRQQRGAFFDRKTKLPGVADEFEFVHIGRAVGTITVEAPFRWTDEARLFVVTDRLGG